MLKAVRIGALVVLASCSIAAFGAAPASAIGTFPYTFNSNNEGWRFATGFEAEQLPAGWVAAGGSPSGGGAIEVADTFPGSGSALITPSSAVFGGDYSNHYGGTISMEVKTTVAWTHYPSVELFGPVGSEPLCGFQEAVKPSTSYQTMSFVLDAEHILANNCETLATPTQVAERLADLQALLVTAEDGPNTGEHMLFDNINLSGGGPLPLHKLTVLKGGSGSGTISSSPAGIDCGATCAKSFQAGAEVTLTATPAAGSKFGGWSGGGCSSTSTCTVSLSADREVTAIFEPAPSGGGNGGNPPVGGGNGGNPPVVTPTPKALTCKKGFRKKKVHGKFRCVKLKQKRHHRHHHHH